MRALTAAHIRAIANRAATVVVVAAIGVAGLADTGRHTVRRGETLSEIAADHGTTVAALAAANGLADANRIIAGQVLAIPAAAPATHVVARGETLGRIARRYGVSIEALAAANGIADADLVHAGRRLTIPGAVVPGGGTAPAAATHLVTAGETLDRIARRYGVSIQAIVDANGLRNPNLVRIGQSLAIPGSTGAAPGGADGRTGVAGTHTVAPGESLAGIAARYGIALADLAAANGILAPYVIYAGSRLRLDAGNSLPGPLAACPLPGAGFANDWGLPRSGGRAHEGNDLFAPRGTPVLAPVAGTVTTAVGTIGGLQFRLRGDDGHLYLGSHLDAFGASGRVAAGAVIGYVGDSGNARGGRPHLHFEVHPGGGPAVNPYPVLRAAC